MSELLKPFQKAIYFPEELPSGGTIGHYCTVIDVLQSSSQLNPTCPDLWLYRVFVHHFKRYMNLPACDLFGLDEFDPDFLAKGPREFLPACEVRFDHPLEADNETISGTFRLPGRTWESFHFRKWEMPYSGYELARPVRCGNTEEGTLAYRVPRTQRLNRSCVLTAITEITGVAIWQSESEWDASPL